MKAKAQIQACGLIIVNLMVHFLTVDCMGIIVSIQPTEDKKVLTTTVTVMA